MSILSRVSDIMDANINAVLDKLEDPSKMVDKYLKDAMENLAEVKKETAGIMAAEKARKRERDELAAKVNEYQGLAARAVEAGNDDDARAFLTRKQQFAADLEKAEANYQVAKQQAEQIVQMHDKLVSDIDELRRRQNNVKATAALAKTQETLNKSGSFSAKGAAASSAFDRMEQKAQARLDRAQAESELNARPEDPTEDLKKKYAAGGSQSVEDELAALKANLGQTPSDGE